LGNIYADEALFRAAIDPRTAGGELDTDDLQRLLNAIQDVLATAIDNGGTSLDDLAYLLPDGRAGENLNQLMVYGRDGEPCKRCGEIIDRAVIRARSTHFCPGCQVKR
jgi:formamidopyrimidine-DNA glycosylase